MDKEREGSQHCRLVKRHEVTELSVVVNLVAFVKELPDSPKLDSLKKLYSVSSITFLVRTFCYCNSEQSQHS